MRAGVLEQGTVDTLIEVGVGERMLREGLVHDGIEIRFNRQRHRIDFPSLTGGKRITVYGQGEVVKDLIDARLDAGDPIHFEVEGTSVHDFDGDQPRIRYRKDGAEHEIACDFIAGCDGFHGICRQSFPEGALTAYERVYPYAWLGILSESTAARRRGVLLPQRDAASPSSRSARRRSAGSTSRSIPTKTSPNWPDDRFWEELEAADGNRRRRCHIPVGPVLQKGITPMRSFVVEPMQSGRLFLAGNSAHIVPPTGAKGMNLAVADIRYLAEALAAFYKTGDSRAARWLFGALPAPHLEGAAFLLVDDHHAPPQPRRHALRSPPPDRRARLCDELRGRHADARRELCRPAFR